MTGALLDHAGFQLHRRCSENVPGRSKSMHPTVQVFEGVIAEGTSGLEVTGSPDAEQLH